jgi:hypothetical protein
LKRVHKRKGSRMNFITRWSLLLYTPAQGAKEEDTHSALGTSQRIENLFYKTLTNLAEWAI